MILSEKIQRSRKSRIINNLEEEKKQERIRIADEKKGNSGGENLQKKITDVLNKLPRKERENYLAEEEGERKLELKTIKENMWKKWGENTIPRGKQEIDFDNSKLEGRLKNKEAEREEKLKRDKERKRTLM